MKAYLVATCQAGEDTMGERLRVKEGKVEKDKEGDVGSVRKGKM